MTAGKCIFIRREDKLRQAISFYRARKTRTWVKKNSDDSPIPTEFLPEKIISIKKVMEKREVAWIDYFAQQDIEPLEIWYETLEKDPVRVIRKIGRFLEVDLPKPLLPHSTMKIMRDKITEDWVEEIVSLESSNSSGSVTKYPVSKLDLSKTVV